MLLTYGQVSVLPAPARNFLELPAEAARTGLAFHHRRAPTGLSPIVGEAQQVEGSEPPLPCVPLSRSSAWRTTEIDSSGFLRVDRQAVLAKPLRQDRHHPICILLLLKHHDEVSSPGESHPQALSEPGVNLSAHRAPIIQPMAESPSASGQRVVALGAQSAQASIPPADDVDSAFCISVVPSGSGHRSYA